MIDLVDVYGLPGFREPVSSILHLLGAVFAAGYAPALVRRGLRHGCNPWPLILFAFACVLLLSLSGVYHMFSPVGSVRPIMKRLDVAAIFVLIAATATPLYVQLFKGKARWILLLSIWTVAIAGLTLRTIYFDSFSPWFGLGIFLAMGWMGSVAALVIWRRYGFSYMRWLVAGGLAYTLGAIGLGLKWPTPIPGFVGPHEVWHVAVLVGIACHWTFIWQVAGGPPTPHHDWDETVPVEWDSLDNL